MGEGYIHKFIRAVQWTMVLWFSVSGLLVLAIGWALLSTLSLDLAVIFGILAACWLLAAVIAGFMLGSHVTKPMRFLTDAILHISPSEHLVAAPNIDSLQLGREVVSSLTRQVYELATSGKAGAENNEKPKDQTIIEQLPVPIIGLNESGVITMSNSEALKATKTQQLAGMQLDKIFLMTFDASEEPLETWLNKCRSASLTAKKSWQKVEVKIPSSETGSYFDIVASFSKHNSSGVETILALYEHSDIYDQDQSSMSFVALAVHELRTPLTILRGYIEALEEELAGKLTPELSSYMRNMVISAESLSVFITNILNVARVDQNQLALHLDEENWQTTLTRIIEALSVRTNAYEKTIELTIEPDLPSVAVDSISITEVVTNLIDNAVKYSPATAKTITVKSFKNGDGLIETTVQDQGVGIPSSIMPHLFSKFYRNHRNRAHIGGTGLGLYLCKALITAHGGNIVVDSKEGEGSTFSFTILPYSRLAEASKTDDNTGITRQRHGWIKNHTMNRR